MGSDWWEQLSAGYGGGDMVPKPVSEGGVEEFERFSRWMEDSTCGEYPVSAVVEQDDLVRDVVFLCLGLSSQSFELALLGNQSRTGAAASSRVDVEGVAGEGAVFGVRSQVRCGGVGVSPLRSLLVDLCVMGTHVHRLGLFVRRNRYDCGKVLGALCGSLADYLQHYRRQILSLPQAGALSPREIRLFALGMSSTSLPSRMLLSLDRNYMMCCHLIPLKASDSSFARGVILA